MFESEWYKKSGSSICLTLIITIVLNTLINPAFALMSSVKRAIDHKFQSKPDYPNDRFTSKLTQFDYEEVNLGIDFAIQKRYNTLITYVFITIIYGGGMPILNLISAIYFGVTYWVDKTALVKAYKKPPNYNSRMAKGAFYWFKWAVLIRLIVSTEMYRKGSIL